MPPPGLLSFPSWNTASPCTCPPSTMHWPCGMAGHHPHCHQNAFVTTSSWWSMHSHVQEGPSLKSGITKFATSLPIYLQRCEIMSVLNPIYNLCCLINGQVPLPTHSMAQGSTYQPMECWVGDTRRPFFT